MEDKKQDVNSLEELVKTADSFREFFSNLANELAKILPDVEIPDEEEEETWEMKCPYKDGDEYYFVSANGLAKYDSWDNYDFEKRAFAQGNIFKTQQEAELESKRRNLLTRFRAFRDECNGNWKPEWTENTYKWSIYFNIDHKMFFVGSSFIQNDFCLFGYFKNKEDAERAIELFGDEIKALFVDCEV